MLMAFAQYVLLQNFKSNELRIGRTLDQFNKETKNFLLFESCSSLRSPRE